MNHEADRFAARVEEVSRALFKRRHRLAVCGWIRAVDGAFYVREIASALGIGDNQIAPDFAALREIDALERFETPDRENWHRAADHPLWPFVDQLLRDLAETESPGSGEMLLARFRVEFLRVEVPPRHRLGVRAPVGPAATTGPPQRFQKRETAPD